MCQQLLPGKKLRKIDLKFLPIALVLLIWITYRMDVVIASDYARLLKERQIPRIAWQVAFSSSWPRGTELISFSSHCFIKKEQLGAWLNSNCSSRNCYYSYTMYTPWIFIVTVWLFIWLGFIYEHLIEITFPSCCIYWFVVSFYWA